MAAFLNYDASDEAGQPVDESIGEAGPEGFDIRNADQVVNRNQLSHILGIYNQNNPYMIRVITPLNANAVHHNNPSHFMHAGDNAHVGVSYSHVMQQDTRPGKQPEPINHYTRANILMDIRNEFPPPPPAEDEGMG